jgi:RNA polymerase sigma-70 factor (ECF subfamily)
VGDGNAELVVAAQRGDENAFAALVERHWPQMVGLARSMVGDAEAEDAAQEGFVTAWRKLRDLRDPNAFRAWISRALVRSCWRRSQRHTTSVPLALVTEPEDPGTGEALAMLDVERLLRMLAPRQRAVMHLTVVAGLSDREIGEVLEIDAGSVRAHRRRARDRLRSVLEAHGR